MTERRLTLTSARHQPFNYLVSLKVGSTFLRNLTYVLDHGKPYSQQEADYPKSLHSRALTREELMREVSFFVVRDPVARFFSLYFDKVVGTPENRFEFITEKLRTHRIFHEGPELTLEQHRENCMSLLGFLGVRLRRNNGQKINPHWSQQISRLGAAVEFGLKPLMLEKLEPQLLQIAEGRIEGLEAAMGMVKSRNRSPRPVEIEDVLTPKVYNKIVTLYPADIQLYDLVKTGWEVLGHPPDIKL